METLDRKTLGAIPRYREIVRLHEGGLSFNAIARLWQLTPQRCQALYRRAKVVLARDLEAPGK